MDDLNRACRRFITNVNRLEQNLALNPVYLEISVFLLEIVESIIKLQNSIEAGKMDKKIKKIKKGIQKSESDIKELEKIDKKRDPSCELGKKVMKNKKKHN